MKSPIPFNPVYALMFAFFLYSCGNEKTEQNSEVKDAVNAAQISKLGWIEGTWTSQSPDGDFIEAWNRIDENHFSGNSYMIKGKDTLFSEGIQLFQSDTGLFYMPAVSDQNEKNPIPFKFVSIENGGFVFENKNHDFPQRIIYKNPHPDTLHAWIEGTVDGVFKKEDFKLSRKK